MRKTALFLLLIMLFTPSTSYANNVVIKGGTEVLLKVIDRLKSGEVKKDSIIQFLVEKAVKSENGFVLIEDGANAYGTVIKSEKKGIMGTAGSLEIAIDKVEAFNDKDIPLRGTREDKGASSTGAVVAGALFVSVLSVFFSGVDAVIPAGTILRAYVAETTILSGDVAPKTEDKDSYFQGNAETDQKLNELFKEMEEKKTEE